MVLNELNKFIQSNPDPRELKRALAVQMVLKGYKHRQIQSILGISSGLLVNGQINIDNLVSKVSSL